MSVNVLDENGMLTWKLTPEQAGDLYGAILFYQTVGVKTRPMSELQAHLLHMIVLAQNPFNDEQKPPSSGKEDVMETTERGMTGTHGGGFPPGGGFPGRSDRADVASPVASGTVRERVTSLRREVEGLSNVTVGLIGVLSPVLRNTPPPPAGSALNAPSRVSPAEQRAPQCSVAIEVDEIEQMVRGIVANINLLINGLEV